MKRGIFWSALLAAFTVFILATTTMGSQRWQQLIVLAIFFAVVGGAWNIQAGFAGVLGLGNAGFVAIGAYTSILLSNKHNASPWLTMWLGAAISVAFGVAIAYICLRANLRGLPFAIATFASAQVLFYLALDVPGLGGAEGIRLERIDSNFAGFRFTGNAPYLVIIAVLLVLTIAGTLLLLRGRAGLYMRAIRENENAAAMSGVPVMRYRLIAVAISALITSLAGTFYAQFQFSVSPEAVLGLSMALSTVIYTVVGGTGYVLGPVIGGVVLVFLTELAQRLSGSGADTSNLRMIMYGTAIILVAMLLPGGLASIREKLARRAAAAAPPSHTHSIALAETMEEANA
jgi:branched-chain amino acid transport system permease protein